MRAVTFSRHGIMVGETRTKWEKMKPEYKKEPIVFYDYPTKSQVRWIRKDTRKSSKNS